jgi:hypothetical protein
VRGDIRGRRCLTFGSLPLPTLEMDDLVLAKLNLNVFGSNFGAYPTPPLTPLSFQAHHGEGSYFPDVRCALTSPDRG